MHCYVNHPRSGAELPPDLNKDNTLFYPESRMTTHDCLHSSRPKDYHIVTDCPYLVPLYSRHEVFVWKDGRWKNPEIQTYGTSFSLILQEIFGCTSSIPRAVLDGKTTNCMGSR